MFICIAGKNRCSIDALRILIKKKFSKKKIFALPNSSDDGQDNWQPSFKKYAIKNKIKIVTLNKLYKIRKLIFFSLEYEKIINVDKFKSKELFNYHFSLLPKYRGCHTNFLQIYYGEKYSGVTLHKINKGIDTGEIIDKNILNSNYIEKKQDLSKGKYYKRSSVNYGKINKLNMKKDSLKLHNKIRALIFPPYQIPVVNGIKVKKSIYRNNKIYLIESFSNKFKNR